VDSVGEGLCVYTHLGSCNVYLLRDMLMHGSVYYRLLLHHRRITRVIQHVVCSLRSHAAQTKNAMR